MLPYIKAAFSPLSPRSSTHDPIYLILRACRGPSPHGLKPLGEVLCTYREPVSRKASKSNEYATLRRNNNLRMI